MALRSGGLSTGRPLRARIAAIMALLALANVAAWAWALIAFRQHPLLIGAAMLAYTFGLRHAFDADHIAAIDNVTRKLMQQGQRPVGIGLFFSLGHSSIVVALTLAIALASTALQDHFGALKSVGALVGTMVSALFLFAIALANLFVFLAILRTFRRVKSGGAFIEGDLDLVLANRGLLSMLLRRAFRLIGKSWHMYPLGALFGLGFDTATEIGLIGLSASQAAQGLSIWSILIFPALFTAGMTLIDTADSILMLGAYGWAFVKPIRKLYYNLTITFVSVVVAFAVGAVEALSLIGERLELTAKGGFFGFIGRLSDNFGLLGAIIVGLFALSWLASFIVYRARGYDDIEIRTA